MSARKLKIPKEFFETSDGWGWRASLRLLGVPLIHIALLPFWAGISPWLAVAAIVPLGIAISKTTLLVHEAVHASLFKTPPLNRIFGRVGGWWTLVDFVSFDALHRKHHATVGANDDPQLRMARPFLASLGEFAGLFAVQATFFLLATQGGRHLWLGLIFPLSAATVGLFMSQIRGFCEHVPMPGESGAMRLRSHEQSIRAPLHPLSELQLSRRAPSLPEGSEQESAGAGGVARGARPAYRALSLVSRHDRCSLESVFGCAGVGFLRLA